MDRNCLSYWFPRLVEAGLPVPRTEIIRTEIGLIDVLDGKVPAGFRELMTEIADAVHRIGGLPAFLRTGQGSGKHYWSQMCHLTDLAQLSQHVYNLVEWSNTVDFFGLPHDVWVIREMLPVDPIAILPRYSGMPLVREVRCFVGEGRVRCLHPYWPSGSIEEGFCRRFDSAWDDESEREPLPDGIDDLVQKAHHLDQADEDAVSKLAGRVAAAFAGDGSWSVDILETKRGWHITDMAEAERSFHWPECERAKG